MNRRETYSERNAIKSQDYNSDRDENNATPSVSEPAAASIATVTAQFLWKFTSSLCLTCPVLHALQQLNANSATCSYFYYKPSPFSPFLGDLIMLGDWAKMTDACEHEKCTVVNVNLSSVLSDSELLLWAVDAKHPREPGEVWSWFQDLSSTLHCHKSCTTHWIWHIFTYKTPER